MRVTHYLKRNITAWDITLFLEHITLPAKSLKHEIIKKWFMQRAIQIYFSFMYISISFVFLFSDIDSNSSYLCSLNDYKTIVWILFTFTLISQFSPRKRVLYLHSFSYAGNKFWTCIVLLSILPHIFTNYVRY